MAAGGRALSGTTNPPQPGSVPSASGNSSQPSIPSVIAPQSVPGSVSASLAGVPLRGKPATAGPPSSGAAVVPSAPAPIRKVPDMEAHIIAATTTAEVLQNADLTQPAIRALASARIAEIQEAQQESAFEKAARLGIPTRIDGPGEKVSILYDFRGDRPIYRTTNNVDSAISTGANLIQPTPYGLDGTGIKVGVWDQGSVRSTHQEFGGRVTLKDPATGLVDHSTHVAGTIGAAGVDPNAKGMAPNVLIDSYDWTNDYAEMTAAGAATSADTASIPISSHSYGYTADATDMGRYETEASSLDAVAYDLPYYLIYWAAGNSQTTLPSEGGYQSITFTGLGKNIVTVGAVNPAVSGGARSPAAGTMSSFSSWGPCDDGRIKPDVVADGVSVFSTLSTTDNAYGTMSGTSMATPSTAGSSVLLEQLYEREFPGQFLRASMLKGLLIHTADDLGTPGPDYQYGWGLINVKAAADVILAHKASLGGPKLIEGTITPTTTVTTQTFVWNGSSPIRATLCWTDPAGAVQSAVHTHTPNLVNDLDLEIIAPDGTTTYLPYTMPFVGTWTQASMALPATKGTNHTDTVERVDVDAPTQPGTYTVRVSLYGSLTGSSQAYSLIVTGGISNPAPTVVLDSPADGATFFPGAPITLRATATDVASSGGNGTITNVEFFNGTTSLGIATSAPYSLIWTPPGSGSYVLSACATDTEGGVGVSANAKVAVLSGDGTPGITSFTPLSSMVGGTVVITGSNFSGVTAVRFNGVACLSYTVDSLTQITAVVPPAATSGAISVITGHGTATSVAIFTVIPSPVLISQIYTGGGAPGATYNANYIELYNRSSQTVDLSGWSIQFAPAGSSAWDGVGFPPVSMAPGSYLLLQLASGANGAALPWPDLIWNGDTLSAGSAKVALRGSCCVLTGSSPVGESDLLDFVGFGSSDAYEGSGPAPTPSKTTALFRAGNGATNTDDNAVDFSARTPNPRNSAGAVISANGTLSEVTTTYGTPSASPASFTLSGTNISAGILVTPPAGFEISQTPGGATGYAVSQTVGTTGAVGATSVYLRLAATAGVGTYSGNVVCTSSGATTVNVPTTSSDVLAKSLSITANDQTKAFGTVLSLGPGQAAFTPVGLANNETISSVTLSSNGGLAAYDRLGAYQISPSSATGGTFNPSNYNIIYLSGTLTVTGHDYASWIGGKLSGPNALPGADPDGDGLSNLAEFFMGLDPAANDSSGATGITLAVDQLSYTYRKNKSATGITGAVKWKNNLLSATSWSSAGVTDVLVSDQGSYEIRRASVTLGAGETTKFLRLEITVP